MFSSTEMLQASRGKIPAKLVLKNAVVLNVFTKEWLTQDVAVWDGRIIGVGRYEGREEIDLTGKYLVPGFFDAHVHIESSMLTPAAFAAEILPFGTTTILADPHELANVSGEKGIRWLLEEIKRLPLNGYVMLPSCVPATELDDSGARLEAEDLLPLREDPRFGPGGIYECFRRLRRRGKSPCKAAGLFEDRVIDGHAPGLVGKDLQAYLLAGVSTDHECSEPEEALEQLRSGMNLMIRRGSGAKTGKRLSAPFWIPGFPQSVCASALTISMWRISGGKGISAAISARPFILGWTQRRHMQWPASTRRGCTGSPI